jgi:hypothetical protein
VWWVPVTLIPDLQLCLELNAFAPKLARHRLAEVGALAPDLRDAVSLLTSDLVTRAVRGCPAQSGPQARLSAWMPSDLVRVQLTVPSAELPALGDVDCWPHERMLLDQIADRWSIEAENPTVCMWFEIDHH